MAQHLAAYFQSVDQAAIAAIATVNDDVLTRQGTTRFTVPEANRYLHWAAAVGLNLTRAQIVTPSIGVRRMNLEVYPRRTGAVAFTLTHPEFWKPRDPFALETNEDLEFWTAENGAGATAQYGLIALGPQQLPPAPNGDVRVVRLTGSTTLVANTWTTCTLTPDTTLQAGLYALVDFLPISATGIAARAIIPNQNNRPGMPCLAGTEATATDFDDAIVRQLAGYNMGQFQHNQIPQFQFLASAADTAETVLARLVRVG